MSEGYIIIKRGWEILWAVMSEDADFNSEFCTIARELFMTANVDACKKALLARMTKIKGVPAKQRAKEIYKRTAKNKGEYLPSYAYEYDTKRNRLSIYISGRKASTFDRNQIDYFDFFIKNYRRILHGYGRSYKDFTINEAQAWDTFNFRKRYGTPLADIDRSLTNCIAQNSIIVGRDKQDPHFFGVGEFMKDIYFYNKKGERESNVRLVVYFSRNTKAGNKPDYRFVLYDNHIEGFVLEKATTLRALKHRLGRKLKDGKVIAALKKFAELQKEETKLGHAVENQWRVGPFEQQEREVERFSKEMEKEIKAAYAGFNDEDFSAIAPKGFNLEDRKATFIKKLLQYRKDLLGIMPPPKRIKMKRRQQKVGRK